MTRWVTPSDTVSDSPGRPARSPATPPTPQAAPTGTFRAARPRAAPSAGAAGAGRRLSADAQPRRCGAQPRPDGRPRRARARAAGPGARRLALGAGGQQRASQEQQARAPVMSPVSSRVRAWSLVALLLAAGALPLAQTKVTPPKNKYTPEQDVAARARSGGGSPQAVPGDRRRGDRVVPRTPGRSAGRAAPPELNHPVFEYSFTPVNLKDINAFALPGGPMFVNRGMFEAARSEGEVVGVMAHELSHVLLRHGTANATKAQGFQLGAARRRHRRRRGRRRLGTGDLAGQPVRARHVADEVQPRVREAGRSPRRADHGARRLRPARPRADVRDDLRSRASAGAPEWMSSHPDPGNRSAYIAAKRRRCTIAPRNLSSRPTSTGRARRSRRCRRPNRWPISRGTESSAAEARAARPRSAGSAIRCRRPRRSTRADAGRATLRCRRAVELAGPDLEQQR